MNAVKSRKWLIAITKAKGLHKSYAQRITMSLENKLNPTLNNNIEDKVWPTFFSKIRKSVTGEIATYGLVFSLVFGTFFACCAHKKPSPISLEKAIEPRNPGSHLHMSFKKFGLAINHHPHC